MKLGASTTKAATTAMPKRTPTLTNQKPAQRQPLIAKETE